MSEVHATWAKGGKPLCNAPGERFRKVIIRRPGDWGLVSCAVCNYVATGDRKW